MKAFLLTGTILFFMLRLPAQESHQSIHIEQQSFYGQFGERGREFYDSLSNYAGPVNPVQRSGCQLKKVVFGFHPYWAGSDYVNYQWNLLSVLCYFSYEVDPSTGWPVTCHDWLTDPAIDSAKANGVKVHLCATIFSGHNNFFASTPSRKNLADSLILLVQQRGADGINMDIEAVPGYLRDSVTAFMRDLSVQLKAVLPQAEVSIELPAVDWDNAFNVSELDAYVDFFFIMGYDYYWNGSEEAGPVSPLYSLTSGYDYSLSRTISTYESACINKEKLILGIPYYGRQWKTQSNIIPSPRLAYGTALTYASIRNNSGNYNSLDYFWEPNSFSSCYIFFQNGNWYQCFIGLGHDLRKKYDIVNYRGQAGIGIWALGYDNGYDDLWQAISDKFSDCYIPLTYDTIYDSGGPVWNYYSGEDYMMTIDHGFNDLRWLSFTGFGLEEGYDSLWIYAGPDTTYPSLGRFTGSLIPGVFSSPSGAFTIRFKSDPLQNAMGWAAVYHDGSMGIGGKSMANKSDLKVFPNPANQYVNIVLPETDKFKMVYIHDLEGRIIFQKEIKAAKTGRTLFHLNLSNWPEGVYTIVFINNSGQEMSSRVIKQNH